MLLLTMNECMAQLCQGSLGDPVVNITFGHGANPGPQLSAATTNYAFISGDCPNDSFYTVRSNTTACFGNSWHSLTQDHTGDGNGYFMLVNASFQPSDFYVDTVTGLCPNTTFEFAAWITNVLKPSACSSNGIKPNLTFTIETTTGSVLQTFKSGDIYADNSPVWKQYGFFFKTPPDVNDIVVRIRNNAPGGCGNDLALDDITFRPCGPMVTVAIPGETTGTKSICYDDATPYTLKASVSDGYANPAYQWQVSTDNINWTDIAGATTTTYKRTQTVIGKYYYRLAVAEAGNITSPKCRIVSNTILFDVQGKPVTTAGSNSPACESSTLTLTATGGVTFQWTGPNNYNGTGSPANITNASLSAAGKYYVTVTSSAGCVQQDSVTVVIIPKPHVDAGASAGICEGESITLNGSGGTVYLWQPATGLSATDIPNPVATPADSIVYTLTVKDDASVCSAVDSVAINVYRKPTANAGADKVMIEGQSVKLTGIVSGTLIDYNWTPVVYINNAAALTPVVSPPRDTTYTLHVVSQAGCGTATDNVFIKVYKKVIIPNAFSPNKDGINDTWNIIALDAYPNAVLTVFNRYGKAVFTSQGSYTAWDGTYNSSPLPVGTYYYVIDTKLSFLPLLTGWVTILR